MPLKPYLLEFAGFCAVCRELVVLYWHDSGLDKSVCDDCAECLAGAEIALSNCDLDHPSPELIEHNP